MSEDVLDPTERRDLRRLCLVVALLVGAAVAAGGYGVDLLLRPGAHPHLTPPDPSSPIGYYPRMARCVVAGLVAFVVAWLLIRRLARPESGGLEAARARLEWLQRLAVGLLFLGAAITGVTAVLFP